MDVATTAGCYTQTRRVNLLPPHTPLQFVFFDPVFVSFIRILFLTQSVRVHHT
jgi:hypothetical protein